MTTDDHILIRKAGPYRVTTDGRFIFCNGVGSTARPVVPTTVRNGRPVTHLVDTGRKGANGKKDVVGLTDSEFAIYRAEYARRSEAEIAAYQSSLKGQREALAWAWSGLREDDYQARHDAVEAARVTGRGTAVKDMSLQIEAAKQALDAFDRAHPEVKEAIQADRDRALANAC